MNSYRARLTFGDPAPPGPPTPAPSRGDVVVRPKLLWRLGLPALAVWFVHLSVNVMPDEGETPGIYNVLLFAFIVFGIVLAWRDLTVIDGPLIYQRGLTRWKAPLDIREVNWVNLSWDFDRSGYHRTLTFGGGAEAWRRRYTLRWWGGWRDIVRWLVRHCSQVDPTGHATWSVGMPAKARARLDSYARKLISRPM